MIRSAKAFLLVASTGLVCLAQTPSKTAAPTPAPDSKSDAYYHFAMGRLYAEMGQAEGNRNEINKAIQNYEEALKLDPDASIIFEELSDLYIATNRLQDAITQAEAQLKENPDNLGARRMLAHVYMRAMSNGQNGINEDALRKAMDQYQKIVQKDPKDAESWVMLGRLNGYLHNTPEAEKNFNQALQLEPDSEDALVGLAELYGQLGDSKRAAEKLKAAVDKHPSPRTLYALAQAYEDLEDYKDAADALQHALEAGAEDERIPAELGRDLLASGQTDQALKLYQDMAAQNPRDPETQLRLCEIYTKKHDLVKARGAFSRVKALAGTNPRVRFAEVPLLEAEGKKDQADAKDLTNARSEADAALKIYPKDPTIAEEHALVLGDQGKVDDAVAEIRALAKGKANTKVLLEIAQIYEKAKRYSDTEKTLDEAEKAAGSDADKLNVYFQRGALYDQEKKFDQAEAEFKKVLAMDPDNASALNYLGYSLADRNVRMDEAAQMVKKALDLDPNNYAYMDSLGWVYYRQGKLDQAEELLIRAVEQTKDPTVHDHLGDVYFKEGKTREAVMQWQTAVKEYNAGSSDMEPDALAKVTQKLQSAQAQLAKHQN